MSAKYICSAYRDRPLVCKEYPWNIANQIFADCQFLNEAKDDLLTMEDLQKVKSDEEISDYCVGCGKCCFFGPAACSNLRIKQQS